MGITAKNLNLLGEKLWAMEDELEAKAVNLPAPLRERISSPINKLRGDWIENGGDVEATLIKMIEELRAALSKVDEILERGEDIVDIVGDYDPAMSQKEKEEIIHEALRFSGRQPEMRGL